MRDDEPRKWYYDDNPFLTRGGWLIVLGVCVPFWTFVAWLLTR